MKRIIDILLTCVLALTVLVGCGPGLEASSRKNQPAVTVQVAQAATDEPATPEPPDMEELAESVAEAIEDHADAEAEVLDSSGTVRIALNGDSISVDGEGASVAGGTVTVTDPGTYSLRGSLTDGQVIVDAENGVVGLVLDGVGINNSTGPAIHIISAQEAVIVLADDIDNKVSDGDARAAGATDNEPTAAIFSMVDLTISGNGTLDVDGNYQDGITSKDGLVVAGGTISIRAVDDGIRGRDYLIVQGGEIAVTAGGDGLKSDNEEDATRGYVRIEDGIVDVSAGGDAIQAQTVVMVTGGELALVSGGGNTGWLDEDASAKGIKAAASVVIDGGIFSVDSADDAVHSNGRIVINDGTFVLSTGDDGIHADATLEVNGGDIRITDSYEGLESAAITINGGEIRVVSRDDGVNAAGGNDRSGFGAGLGRGRDRGDFPPADQGRMPSDGQMPDGRPPGGDQMPGERRGGGPPPSGRPDGDRMPGGGPGRDAFALGDYYLHINGGYIAIDAYGDGLDVNGPIEMTGGVVLISGPTQNMNGALDYMGQFDISGGFLVAAGSTGMAQAPSESSTQYSLLVNFNDTAEAGTLVHIQTSEGEQVLTFAPAKQYRSLAFSSTELEPGSAYDIYLGGSSDGEVSDGLYQGGSYASGTEYTSFTVSDMVTRLGGRRR